MFTDELSPLAPPHSIEAEQSVLSAILMVPDSLANVLDLQADMFYRKEHRLIWEAAREIASQGGAVDALTVAESLRNRNLMAEAGGLSYLEELIGSFQSATNIAAYAAIIRERAMLRSMIVVGNDIAKNAYNPEGQKGESLLAQAHAALLAVTGAESHKGPAHINEALYRTSVALEKREQQGGKMIGISSGFIDLDEIVGGFKPGEMILVAGRPSMGKSTLAQNFIEHAVLDGKHVLFFSVEMPEEMVTIRHLSSIGRVPLESLIQARIGDHGDKVLSAGAKLKNRFYRIDDSPSLISSQILLRAQQVQAKTKKPIDLIVIDYLQKLRDPGDNQNVRVQEISGNVKHAARALNCPVIALSQLSRECEKRNDKRPMLSDLRDSGALEQDADVIMFVYRDEIYNEVTNWKGTAEILVRKNRNGRTGNVLLTTQLDLARFENFTGKRPTTGAKSYDLE